VIAVFRVGDSVRVADVWEGRPVAWSGERLGTVVGEPYGGASRVASWFVPVMFRDGRRRGVDSRVLERA